jgi:hypothetical protein
MKSRMVVLPIADLRTLQMNGLMKGRCLSSYVLQAFLISYE